MGKNKTNPFGVIIIIFPILCDLYPSRAISWFDSFVSKYLLLFKFILLSWKSYLGFSKYLNITYIVYKSSTIRLPSNSVKIAKNMDTKLLENNRNLHLYLHLHYCFSKCLFVLFTSRFNWKSDSVEKSCTFCWKVTEEKRIL